MANVKSNQNLEYHQLFLSKKSHRGYSNWYIEGK